jgi:hypothetical protein
MRYLENQVAKNSGYTKLSSPIHPHRFLDPYFVYSHEEVMKLYPESFPSNLLDGSSSSSSNSNTFDWVCVDGLKHSDLLKKCGDPVKQGGSIASQVSNQSNNANLSTKQQ